ncbi:MAG TPA: TonB-dependent receptor [Thermoanaerobaculia bacterium]|nr:TonB-dependent receptor [Thermoanaerobaculia bacterium]
MKRLSLRWIAVALAVALLLPISLYAQASGSTLSGRVTDASGGAVPGVTVTATNASTGLQRTAVTDADGMYRLLALPVGTYTVTAELSGFATVKTESVQMNIATPRELNVTLKQAAVSEAITVTAEAPLVATEPAVGTVVSQQELEGLPLNGRQFANLASLAPGTQLSVNADPTKPGQLTVALNGGSGRNVNYIIDGGDNTDDTIGGALQNFNLEAVQEFKIQTMQYKAEYGRSSGGVLTVVTKTGTNDFGGSAYAFFRDKSLNEKTETERLNHADKGEYERKQYGASFGGPIVKDKAHFFATYEKTDRDTTKTVSTGGIFPSLDGSAVPLPFEDELGTAKATWDATARQLIQVRYGFQKNTDIYGTSPLYLPSNQGTINNDYKSILGSHSFTIGGDKLNEFVYQWTRFENAILPVSNDPNIYFPSGVTSGQNFNTPQTTHQEKSQFKDDFSWSSNLMGRRNDFKTGVNFIHEPILGGDFTTGTSGQFQMLNDSATSPVGIIIQYGGFLGDQTPVDQYNVYLQDDLNINPRLTLNLGVRYDLWTGFDLDQTGNPLLPLYKRAAAAHPEISWLEPFANGEADHLENDENNFAPRIGFTYDVKGDSQHIVRGGYGIYYDFPYTNATSLFPASAVQSDYRPIYYYEDPNGIKNANGTFFRPGIDPLPPNQGLGADLPNNIAQKSWEAPESEQISLGYSWQARNWLGLTFDAVHIDYKNIPFRFRANPRVGGTRILQPDTNNNNIRLWVGDGSATYKGFNIGFHARASRFESQGFYTWSQADGNVLIGADEFRLWDGALQPGVQTNALVNPLDPYSRENYGPLYTDARHRVTLSTVYRAPLGINVAGILRYRSALPYTKLAGSDINNDGYSMDLAPGVSHVQTLRGDSFSQLDLRVSKEFAFGGSFGLELIGEIFNLLNSKNPAGFNGSVSNANFGKASVYAGDAGQGEQRLAQLGLRLRF